MCHVCVYIYICVYIHVYVCACDFGSRVLSIILYFLPSISTPFLRNAKLLPSGGGGGSSSGGGGGTGRGN